MPRFNGRTFYARPVEEVARDLLGCLLVHGMLEARIVEVEAYDGPGDPGSHAHRSPNGRARIMFEQPGLAYVHFTYGMHHCLNAVAHPPGGAGAVLIRAAEPVRGVEDLRRGRTLPDRKLASGPGRLCTAFALDRTSNGADLTLGPVGISPRRSEPHEIRTGPRIGLTDDDGRAWRFWTPSPSVSR